MSHTHVRHTKNPILRGSRIFTYPLTVSSTLPSFDLFVFFAGGNRGPKVPWLQGEYGLLTLRHSYSKRTYSNQKGDECQHTQKTAMIDMICRNIFHSSHDGNQEGTQKLRSFVYAKDTLLANHHVKTTLVDQLRSSSYYKQRSHCPKFPESSHHVRNSQPHTLLFRKVRWSLSEPSILVKKIFGLDCVTGAKRGRGRSPFTQKQFATEERDHQ